MTTIISNSIRFPFWVSHLHVDPDHRRVYCTIDALSRSIFPIWWSRCWASVTGLVVSLRKLTKKNSTKSFSVVPFFCSLLLFILFLLIQGTLRCLWRWNRFLVSAYLVPRRSVTDRENEKYSWQDHLAHTCVLNIGMEHLRIPSGQNQSADCGVR